MKNIFLIVFNICFAFAATQKVPAQKVLAVEEAIATTLKNNYDIQLLRNDSASYALDKSYANALFLPRLNATAGLISNNNNQKQKFSDGSEKQRSGIRSSNLSGTVQLNWTLFDGYKMFATKDKLSEFVKLGELNIKDQMVTSIAAVLNNYYSIVYQKQQLQAIKEQMVINAERVKLADEKLSVGLGAKPELLQAKVDLNAQKAALLKQETLIAELKEQLSQLMNVALNTMYDVSDSIPINNNIILDDIINSVESTNPSLLLTKKNIDISYLTLKERKAEKFPVLSFNSAYNYFKTDNKAVINPFTPLYSRTNGFNYGLGLTIPILNGFTAKRLVQQTKLDIDYLKISYQNQKAKIDLGIINAFKNYEIQKQALALEEENILLAKENVMIAAERFRLGVSINLELILTVRSLEDATNRLLAARYNTKLAEIELLRLKGDLVK